MISKNQIDMLHNYRGMLSPKGRNTKKRVIARKHDEAICVFGTIEIASLPRNDEKTIPTYMKRITVSAGHRPAPINGIHDLSLRALQ